MNAASLVESVLSGKPVNEAVAEIVRPAVSSSVPVTESKLEPSWEMGDIPSVQMRIDDNPRYMKDRIARSIIVDVPVNPPGEPDEGGPDPRPSEWRICLR